MLKDTLRKLGPEFGFLTEEVGEVEQDVMNRLDRSVKLDEVDTITFGLETDDGKIVKVYVKVEQAEDFEKALATKLGEIDDIEEVLNTLSKEFEIVDVEWPAEETGDDDEETDEDGSDVLDKKVYDNAKEQATVGKQLKSKMEDLSVGEQFTLDILESQQSGTIESRFTTATQLMVYHAILELGIPEMALSRNAYRSAIIKNIKDKAQELLTSPTMKNALKQFINRSIDYEAHAHKNKTAMDKKVNGGASPGSSQKNESLLAEGLTQDYWDAFNDLVNYVAATPEAAAEFMKIPQMKQLMTRSSGPIRTNVSSQLKVKLNDFKNALTSDGKTNQAKAASVAESYLNSTQLQEAAPAEVTALFSSILSLADSSKGGTLSATIMGSSAWNKFFNAAKTSLSQKFTGQVRAKLNTLKQAMPAQVQVESVQNNAELAHAYSYGSEKFDAGKQIEVIGEDGDYYIVKPFPIMATGHMKLKKSAVKLNGKIEVPVGGNNGEMPGGLNETQVPEWSFEMEEDSVVVQTGSLKVKLNTEEVEKLVKGITNKDAVIVKDEEDPTHKVAFSPRGSSVMVKKVGTTDGIMMKQKDVEDFLSFVATGSDEEETEDGEEVVADSETSPLVKKESKEIKESTDEDDHQMKIGDEVYCLDTMRTSKAYAKFGIPAKAGDEGKITRINNMKDVSIIEFQTASGKRFAHIQNLMLSSDRKK